jgi:hypothetical protein
MLQTQRVARGVFASHPPEAVVPRSARRRICSQADDPKSDMRIALDLFRQASYDVDLR